MKTVIGKDVAIKSLNDWHDYRRIKEGQRISLDPETGKDVTREKLIEAFEYGILIFEEKTGVLIQKLEWPVKTESGEIKLQELKWKPRIQERDLNEPMKGVSPKDTFGMMKAYISAATGVNKGFLGSMDLSDYSLSQSINNYFL